MELSIAMHYVFDAPNDKLIFDVGHQCYTHKILTGRSRQFTTLRKKDGLAAIKNAVRAYMIVGKPGTHPLLYLLL